MYLYVYDQFLQERRYESVLARIEARIQALSINGKIERLTVLKSLKELIRDGIKAGAKTVVAVGNDQTMSEVIRLTAGENVTLGYIPVGGSSPMATFLGIPTAEEACTVLSRRIIETIDLGKMNDQYFFSSVEIPAQHVTLECDGRYRVSSVDPGSRISLCNTNLLGERFRGRQWSNPKDGQLEAIVRGEKRSRFAFFGGRTTSDSVFPFRTATVNAPESTAVVADGHYVATTPVTIEIVPHKLRIIVGKERAF